MKRPGEAARRRWSIALRTTMGTLGAYALTSLIVIFLSRLLAQFGLDRIEAVTATTLASFAIFSAIAITVFHAHSAMRASLWLLAFAVPIGTVALLLPSGGAA